MPSFNSFLRAALLPGIVASIKIRKAEQHSQRSHQRNLRPSASSHNTHRSQSHRSRSHSLPSNVVNHQNVESDRFHPDPRPRGGDLQSLKSLGSCSNTDNHTNHDLQAQRRRLNGIPTPSRTRPPSNGILTEALSQDSDLNTARIYGKGLTEALPPTSALNTACIYEDVDYDLTKPLPHDSVLNRAFIHEGPDLRNSDPNTRKPLANITNFSGAPQAGPSPSYLKYHPGARAHSPPFNGPGSPQFGRDFPHLPQFGREEIQNYASDISCHTGSPVKTGRGTNPEISFEDVVGSQKVKRQSHLTNSQNGKNSGQVLPRRRHSSVPNLGVTVDDMNAMRHQIVSKKTRNDFLRRDNTLDNIRLTARGNKKRENHEKLLEARERREIVTAK